MTHDTTSPIKPYSECDRDELLDILKLRDSVIRILESELKALNVQLEAIGAGGASGKRIMGGDAKDAEIARLREAIAIAYGYLWHVNNEPGTPHQHHPERMAYEARKVLRHLMTNEQRGEGINAVRVVLHQQEQEK